MGLRNDFYHDYVTGKLPGWYYRAVNAVKLAAPIKPGDELNADGSPKCRPIGMPNIGRRVAVKTYV
jgi:hypothetical protein